MPALLRGQRLGEKGWVVLHRRFKLNRLHSGRRATRGDRHRVQQHGRPMRASARVGGPLLRIRRCFVPL
jgi:hypothetical protein